MGIDQWCDSLRESLMCPRLRAAMILWVTLFLALGGLSWTVSARVTALEQDALLLQRDIAYIKGACDRLLERSMK